MSGNKKSADTVKKAGTYIFSTVCGAVCSGVLLLVFAAAMYILGLPPSMADALSLISFAAGCALSGLLCGLIKRKNGLRNGVICALALFLPLALISALSGSLSGGGIIPELLTALAASCTGAVIGVNRRER